MDTKMSKSNLQKLKKNELVVFARARGIKNPQLLTKQELINRLVLSPQQDTKRIRSIGAKRQGRATTTKTAQKQTSDGLQRRDKKAPMSEVLFTDYQPDHEGTFEAMTESVSPQEQYQPGRGMPEYLPMSYNVTKLVAMVRDPYWIYTYWDLDENKYNEIKELFSKNGKNIQPVLRIYEITNIIFDGTNSHKYWDIEVHLDAKNWYVYVGEPNKVFVLDLGLRDDQGNFYLIARSNIVRLPLDGPSDVIDEKWMSADFYDLYYTSLLGVSSGELFKKRKVLKEFEWVTSGMVSSPGMVQEEKQNDFFLNVATEFILYGRTKPDAKLMIEGREVKLRPDGSFSLRYCFPDGRRSMPVIAVSHDGDDQRTITVNLHKETK